MKIVGHGHRRTCIRIRMLNGILNRVENGESTLFIFELTAPN